MASTLSDNRGSVRGGLRTRASPVYSIFTFDFDFKAEEPAKE